MHLNITTKTNIQHAYIRRTAAVSDAPGSLSLRIAHRISCCPRRRSEQPLALGLRYPRPQHPTRPTLSDFCAASAGCLAIQNHPDSEIAKRCGFSFDWLDRRPTLSASATPNEISIDCPKPSESLIANLKQIVNRSASIRPKRLIPTGIGTCESNPPRCRTTRFFGRDDRHLQPCNHTNCNLMTTVQQNNKRRSSRIIRQLCNIVPTATDADR